MNKDRELPASNQKQFHYSYVGYQFALHRLANKLRLDEIVGKVKIEDNC